MRTKDSGSAATKKQAVMLENTIVLIGQPRSGTTWIGKIMDSHPDTLYRHEPDSIHRLPIPLFVPAESWAYHAKLLGQFEFGLMQPQQLKTAGKLPLFHKSYYSWPNEAARNLSVYGAHLISRFGAHPNVAEFIPRLGVRPRVVWKSIESLGRAGIIARALQPCRLVYLVRHPCGQVNSVLKGDGSDRFESSVAPYQNSGVMEQMVRTPQAARHGLSMELLYESLPVERLAWMWVVFNEKALDDLEGLQNTTTVVYDEFCRSPLQAARTLLAEVDLPWHPKVEQFVAESISVHSNRFYSIRKDPVRAADSWMESMSGEDVNRVLEVVSRSHAFQLFDGTRKTELAEEEVAPEIRRKGGRVDYFY